ncbi:MAG: MFS transporter [Pseudomonadales bacterium]|nr:MFS transporter [Pseudomonadales bacterium]
MTSESTSAGPPLFYGYILLGYSFTVGFLASSFFLHSRGIFFPVWMEEFGVNRTDISLIITLTLFTGSCLAPVIGWLIDRFPVKWVSCAGAMWMGTGYLLLQSVETYFGFAMVLIGFQGVAWGTLGPLVQTKLMVNWFTRNRGMALGVAIMGLSVAGIVMPTIATFLSETLGWRNAYALYAGILFLVIVPGTVFLVKQEPADIGQFPDGDSQPGILAATPQAQQTNLEVYREFLTSREFWTVVLTFGTMNGVYSALITHLPNYFKGDLGFSLYDASYALGIAGACAIGGKIVWGWLMDHFDAKFTVLIAVASYLGSMLLMMISRDYLILLVACGLFGLSFGAMVPVRSVLLSRLFGVRKYSRVNGLLAFFLAPATFWTLIAGYVADNFGYVTIFQIWACAFVLAGIITSLIHFPNEDQAP